jgi:hypothetical protein
MALVMHHLRTQQPMPDAAEFYPHPPTHPEEAEAKSDVVAKSIKEDSSWWFWSRWKRK